AMIPEMVEPLVLEISGHQATPEDWDWQLLDERMTAAFGFGHGIGEAEQAGMNRDSLVQHLVGLVEGAYQRREDEIGVANMRHLERIILLQVVDSHWKEHLLNMDHLKEGIGLRGYGQKNPLNEYKKEGYEMFMELMTTIKQQTISTLFMVRLVSEDEVQRLEQARREEQQALAMKMQRSDQAAEEKARQPVSRDGDKVGRNDDCPCGSGRKYKRCCGRTK
ncbi:MAG: SEC-C domain-containing protein, partial [Proteobacteria bacterium]|nr:SEC-C domain-containing protein [Pseudomonadota bacterium]